MSEHFHHRHQALLLWGKACNTEIQRHRFVPPQLSGALLRLRSSGRRVHVEGNLSCPEQLSGNRNKHTLHTTLAVFSVVFGTKAAAAYIVLCI